MELISSQPSDDFPINYFNPRGAEGKYGVQHNFRKGCFICLQIGAALCTYPMRGGFIYDEK